METADREIEQLIQYRSRKGEIDPAEQEALWKESERRYNARQREENCRAWIDHSEHMAVVFRQRAAEHDRQARRRRQLLKDLRKARNA